jgi:hypothetical protein
MDPKPEESSREFLERMDRQYQLNIFAAASLAGIRAHHGIGRGAEDVAEQARRDARSLAAEMERT